MKFNHALGIGVFLLYCSAVFGHEKDGSPQDRSSFNWREFFNINGNHPSTPKPPPFKDHSVNYSSKDNLFDVDQFTEDLLGLEKEFLDEQDM